MHFRQQKKVHCRQESFCYLEYRSRNIRYRLTKLALILLQYFPMMKKSNILPYKMSVKDFSIIVNNDIRCNFSVFAYPLILWTGRFSFFYSDGNLVFSDNFQKQALTVSRLEHHLPNLLGQNNLIWQTTRCERKTTGINQNRRLLQCQQIPR